MNTEQRKANERHFLFYLKNKTKMYCWKDTGNVYSMNTGKIVPATLKGYVELAGIVRKDFMNIFVDIPSDNCDWDMEKVWGIIDGITK